MSFMKKAFDFLSGTTMTILGGLFLIPSFYIFITQKEVFFDPAWVTVAICGFPLLYLALTRLIRQRWISSALLICIAMVASIYIGELFAAGEVAFIMALGAILEEKTVERSKKGIQKLIHLAPTQGLRF